jgi:hypothetical protein
MVTVMRLHARLSKVTSKVHFIRWGMTSVGFTKQLPLYMKMGLKIY